jgi:peptide/nickel transport system permease protein
VLKKVLPTLGVTVASSLAGGILAVSSLAYLGIGSQPPTPTWGGMLSDDMTYLSNAGYAPLFPGLAIVIVVGALGLIADGLRDATRTGAIEVTGDEEALSSQSAQPSLSGVERVA